MYAEKILIFRTTWVSAAQYTLVHFCCATTLLRVWFISEKIQNNRSLHNNEKIHSFDYLSDVTPLHSSMKKNQLRLTFYHISWKLTTSKNKIQLIQTSQSSCWLAVRLEGGLYLAALPMLVWEGTVKSIREKSSNRWEALREHTEIVGK